MEIPVGLQPKTCRRCEVKKLRMDFTANNLTCNQCLRKAAKERKIKTTYPRWSKRVSENPREVDKLFDDVVFTPEFLAGRRQISPRTKQL